MGNTDRSATLRGAKSSTAGSLRSIDQAFAKKSANRLVIFTIGLSMLSILLFGCATNDTPSANADADPTVELIRTAVVNTAVPQQRTSKCLEKATIQTQDHN